MEAKTLGEVIDQIPRLDDDLVVFAKRPWSVESPAVIGRLTSDFAVPRDMTEAGLDYFLEVSVALGVLEVLRGRPEDPNEYRRLLMFYAENDAYPPWVFSA